MIKTLRIPLHLPRWLCLQESAFFFFWESSILLPVGIQLPFCENRNRFISFPSSFSPWFSRTLRLPLKTQCLKGGKSPRLNSMPLFVMKGLTILKSSFLRIKLVQSKVYTPYCQLQPSWLHSCKFCYLWLSVGKTS